MAHSPRGWTGARTPSAIKRVRQTERRRAINQPRRSAAKTLVVRTVQAVSAGQSTDEIQQLIQRAASALDRAAKIGAIHPNAASRRKSRLMLKVNAAIGGEALVVSAKAARTGGKIAAAKQERARIAASKASKAKGAQTAAGKARAALARSTRETGPSEEASAVSTETTQSPARAGEKTAASTQTKAKSVSKERTGTTKPAAAKAAKPARATAAKPAATAKPRTARGTTKKS